MRNFAKSILNYFAAFSESRFRFSSKLPYEWSDDPFTLDLSVFPAFQQELLSAIAMGTPFCLKIQKGEHIVSLDPKAMTAELVGVVQSSLNKDFLASRVAEAKAKLKADFANEEPHIIEKKALAEGLHEYNLAFRQEMLARLAALQTRRVGDPQAELGFAAFSPAAFDPQREVQSAFDDMQSMARNRLSIDGYVNEIIAYLRKRNYGFVNFDFHLVLKSYLKLVGAHPVHVFFHEISKGQRKYPLFSVEIDAVEGTDAIEIRSARDLVMLNTPAVNSFEFDTILTIPRACCFAESLTALSGIERFLQAKLKAGDSFILQPQYRPLGAGNLPAVRFRIGLQAVKEEDRCILDYSELITSLDDGAGKRFTEMVGRYVEGKVLNRADEVDRQCREQYPKRSGERLMPKRLLVPAPLNETQRRILTAAEDPGNELIVVEAPPGTGKAQTITTLVHQAGQLGKSVVITSHKRQALDVIDQALSDQFKSLNPEAKPPVLRLESDNEGAGVNNIADTLSIEAIDAALERSQSLNEEVIAKDRERMCETLANVYDRYWQLADSSETYAKDLLEWAQLNDDLLGSNRNLPNLIPPRLPAGITIDIPAARRQAELLCKMPVHSSIESLGAFFVEREKLPEILNHCDELQSLAETIPEGLLKGNRAVPSDLTAFREAVDRIAACFEPAALLRDCLTASVQMAPAPDSIAEIFGDYAGFKRAHEIVTQIADLEDKFLGRLLKAKTIAQRRQQLAQECPKLAEILNHTDAQTTCGRLQDMTDYIDDLKSLNPFLNRDYIIAGKNAFPPADLQTCIFRLGSIEFQRMLSLAAKACGVAVGEMSVAQLQEQVRQLSLFARCQDLSRIIESFAHHIGMDTEDLPKLREELKQANELISASQAEDLAALMSVFRFYGGYMVALGIEAGDVASLGQFVAEPERAAKFFRYLQLHMDLPAHLMPDALGSAQMGEYYEKTSRLLQAKEDRRYGNLLNHAADVQHILAAVNAGKRITNDQASVLLKSLSCIVAAPELISRHFPMESGIIDLLIIDEASQVSVAESIPLMMRARQTIVFGDELQYGAVGAVDISRKYSEPYFKDVLREYATDRGATISETEQERLALEVSLEPDEETAESSAFIPVDPGTREWLKTFGVRTSTLAFAKALQNYSASLNAYIRSFPETISYSNDFFYRPSRNELVMNRIRTKSIGEVLRFIKVDTKVNAGRNVNLDEIDAIRRDIESMIARSYRGTVGVICSFEEQKARMEEIFQQEMAIYPDLIRNHRFAIWFVGDVKCEERDLVYFSFVQDRKLDNADLRTIYPTIGGAADNIRRLKMQRLNVGFSRARDIMVFVHSMPLGDYSDSRLYDALRHYSSVRDEAHDQYVSHDSVFTSPEEKDLYPLILQTPFFQQNRERLRFIAPFDLGKYIRREFHRYRPKYRVDCLLTMTGGGKERSLIIEYDGLEYHTNDPDIVTAENFDREYLEYEVERQLELQSCGYSFLRINKFSLVPDKEGSTRIEMLDQLLRKSLPV